MLVKIEKNGQTMEVHPDAVADHLRLGWKRFEEKPATQEDMASIKAAFGEMSERLEAMGARVRELEGDLELATDDEPEPATVEARIAELEAKLAAGELTKGQKGVLTRLKNSLK